MEMMTAQYFNSYALHTLTHLIFNVLQCGTATVLRRLHLLHQCNIYR